MTNLAVHWDDGLFLRPHHFQLAERHRMSDLSTQGHWLGPYPYGLRTIEFDREALANWSVQISRCELRLQDGTLVRCPEEIDLPPLILAKTAFDRQSQLTVFLGVPRLRLGQVNLKESPDDRTSRYAIESVEVEDENKPGNSQVIDVRRTQARLMLESDDRSGYESLPVMRLRRGTTVDAAPELDPRFIPPLLCCDAWLPLAEGILSNIFHFVGGRVEALSKLILGRGVEFTSGHKDDLRILFELQMWNSALGYLTNLPFVRGVHPLWAFQELCRVVGMRSLFRPERRVPELPRYDHDDLGTGFLLLKELICKEPPVWVPIKRDFVGMGDQLQVRLEREWLEPAWSFFIGVESSLPYHDVVNLLLVQLNMKVGSSRQVEGMFKLGRPAVKLLPEPEPPRVLPHTNWTYWQLDRTSLPWRDVEASLSLAVRINIDQVDGDVNGHKKIRAKTPNGLVNLTLALFALPPKIDGSEL